MPTHGGLAPGFERYGGGRPNVLQAIVDSLGQQRGTLYDTSQASNVYAENMAIGRAISECWSNNQRMANQWDTLRMSEFIPRWEKILGIFPGSTDTDGTRRKRIALAFARLTQAGIYQTVYDQLLSLLGPSVFVGITVTPSANAVAWVPAGFVSTAGTLQTDPLGQVTWYSTIGHILISVTQPNTMLDGDFYQAVATINPVLDNLLPAWITWDWARSGPLHVIPIASSTNTDPVVVTCSTAGTVWAPAGQQHGFSVGQTVTITGSIVGINGVWNVQAVGGTTAGGTGTTLTLPTAGSGGPTSTGAGGAVGTVSAPGFFCDGDPPNAKSPILINTDNEALV